jgi:hypothetical protein
MLPSILEDEEVVIYKLDEPLKMFAVGGKPLLIHYVVKNLPLRIKHFRVRAEVMVTLSLASKDILLGRPFMRGYSVNIQEGDQPQVSFKVARKDVFTEFAPTTIKQSPAFKAAAPSTLIGVKISTNGGLFAPWIPTSRKCHIVTTADIKARLAQLPKSSK